MADISINNLYSFERMVHNTAAVHHAKKDELEQYELQLEVLELDYEDHVKVREVYQKAAVLTQTYLEGHISSIVTNALQSVFYEKNLEFKVEFDKKRNSTECNLTILDDGEEYDLLEDKGFGVSDVSSFALRVAYILLDSVDNVIIMDEPFRNLDKERTPYASKMVSELCKKVGMQLIVSTHIDDLTESADNVIRLKLKSKDTTEILK